MSVASIGEKILIACKYATLAMLLAIWCGVTGWIGALVGMMMDVHSTHYMAATIGALAGLVFAIGIGQLEIEKKKASEDS
jgi:membrane protein DedA with SNARE-associated domain